MENLKITITPLTISYCLPHPHPQKKELSVLLKYKRILISTNYELEKFECKKTFPFPHNATINPNNPCNLDLRHYSSQTSINFQLVKQMELANTKVDIIAIGLLNLGKDVNLLGIASVDLGLFEKLQAVDGEYRKQMNVKLDKCDDPGAYITVEVVLKSIERPKRVEKNKNGFKKSENMEPMGMLETEDYARQSLMMKRRKNPDMPTAYEISHRNYKQVQIVRDQEYVIHDKSNGKNSSYKKRFQYQYEQREQTSNISSKKKINKQNRSQISKPQANQGYKRISPAPRMKTPEPINDTSSFRSKENSYQQKSKKKQNLAHNPKRKKDSISKSHVTERPIEKENKNHRSEYDENNFSEEEKPPYPDSPSQINSENTRQEKRKKGSINNFTPNAEVEKDNKFRMITEKLEKIEKRIMRKDNTDEKMSSQSQSRSQDDEEQIPRTGNAPMPFKESFNPSSQCEEDSQNMQESEVAHFSPKESKKDESQLLPTKKRNDIGDNDSRQKLKEAKNNPFIYESQRIKITPKQNQEQIVRKVNESPISNDRGDSPLEKRSPIKNTSVKEKQNIQEASKQKANTDKYQVNEFKDEEGDIRYTFNAKQEKTVEKERAVTENPKKEIILENKAENHQECEEKITALEIQIEEQEENFRKQLLEKELEYKTKTKDNQERMKDQLKELQVLREDVIKQKSLIEKLNNMYEESDDKNFQLAKDYEKKCLQYDRKMDSIAQKNLSLQKNLSEKQQQLRSNSKIIESLNSELEKIRERLEVSKKSERDLRKENENSKSQSLKSISENDIKIDNKSQSEIKKIKEEYLVWKKKCVNLEADVRYKDNEIRFMKIKNDNLQQEKKDLENEIDMIIQNNKYEMARQGSISKMNLESQSLSTSIKNENKALKSEITNLQSQVHELNEILEGIIKMDKSCASHLSKKSEDHRKNHRQGNDIVLFKKYKALEQKVDAYEEELASKQVKIGRILNLVSSMGNKQLLESIDKLIED